MTPPKTAREVLESMSWRLCTMCEADPNQDKEIIDHALQELAELVSVQPQDLHEWYLEATRELNPESYNPKAQKPYEELTEEQAFIDKYIANKVVDIIRKKITGG